jgi:hypothetical protein
MATSKQQLSRSNVGAWVFKANPQATWDYFAALENDSRAPGVLVDDMWTVGRTYRTHLIQPEDLVVLWITGTKDPGIYEIGKVSGTPEEVDGIDENYLVNPDLANKRTYAVPYRSLLLRHPVPRADMKVDPVLRRCEQFVIPVIGNPTYLTPEQRDALLGFISPADLRTAEWPLARM